MAILVRRDFRVRPADQPEFERQSREGLWPTFLHFGAQMVAFGVWAFGGRADEVTTHTVYEDFAHWQATRVGRGDFYQQDWLMEETRELRPIFASRPDLVSTSTARIIDIDDGASPAGVFYRRPGTQPAEPPPTFGRGSVVSERTYVLREGAEAEFHRLSSDHIWPWLEQAGGRIVAYGQDPLRPPNEVITLFAFRSLADWHRLSRPSGEPDPPPEVVEAWGKRESLIQTHSGKLLTVLTDFGRPV